MSWIFHEPFEAAIHGHRRAYAPLVAGRGFSRTRSFHSLDLFSEDTPPTLRRAYSRAVVVAATIRPFGPARGLLPVLLAAGAWDEAWPTQPRTRFVVGYAPITGDVGLSASFTVSFTGVTPASEGPTGLYADTILTGDQGLAAQSLAILAVDDSAAASTFTGQSASRIV
jgi:hypothetical protein